MIFKTKLNESCVCYTTKPSRRSERVDDYPDLVLAESLGKISLDSILDFKTYEVVRFENGLITAKDPDRFMMCFEKKNKLNKPVVLRVNEALKMFYISSRWYVYKEKKGVVVFVGSDGSIVVKVPEDYYDATDEVALELKKEIFAVKNEEFKMVILTPFDNEFFKYRTLKLNMKPLKVTLEANFLWYKSDEKLVRSSLARSDRILVAKEYDNYIIFGRRNDVEKP